MKFAKTSIALALIASISANVYLVNKAPRHPAKPDYHNTTVDAPVVLRTNGGLLEVSTIKSTESFEVSDSHTIFGIPVGKTVSRVRVPAVFRYHIELAREWKIVLRANTFVVVAPAVKPSLPVAIDTAHFEKDSFGTWSIVTGGAQLDHLQRSITQTLAMKAASNSYVQFQREAARQTVTEFVSKWLITQEKWKAASKFPIQVFFSDEPIQVLSAVPQPFVGSL